MNISVRPSWEDRCSCWDSSGEMMGSFVEWTLPTEAGKILAGASAGEIIFFDPEGRLEEAQYKSCREQPVDQEKWEQIVGRLMNLEKIFGLGLSRKNGHLTATIDGNLQTITSESSRWILPTGELEGYH